MTNEDRDEFKKLLFAMAAAYQKEVDAPMTTGYWMLLMDLPIERVKAATVKAMQMSKFFPSAAEIRELAQEAIEQEQSEEQAQRQHQRYHDSLVWNVLKEAKHYGKDRAYVESELARIGSSLELTLTVDPWLAQQLGDCPLASAWNQGAGP